MVYSLITLFNPAQDVYSNIQLIANQVDKVFLCDNSKNNNGELFNNMNNLEYFFFNKNLGLSAAFNYILLKQGVFTDNDFILFFDQDSIISHGYVSQLIEIYEYLEKKNVNIGCLGPIYHNTSSGRIEVPKARVNIYNNVFIVKAIITSSMLCRYNKLKDVGFWNSDIFLDMADWEICWRFQRKSYLCCMTNTLVLNHTLGKGQKKIGFFKINIGIPLREYYQTRDCLYLFREKYVPIIFKFRFLLMLTIRPILHIVFLDNKKERLFYILKGIRDYQKGIRGEISNNELYVNFKTGRN